MTQSQQQEAFERLVDKMRGIMLKKGNDYSNADRLSNFKQVGAVCNISSAKVALVLASVKISRITNLLDSGAKPNNESLEDSAIDLCIYSILNYMVLSETQ